MLRLTCIKRRECELDRNSNQSSTILALDTRTHGKTHTRNTATRVFYIARQCSEEENLKPDDDDGCLSVCNSHLRQNVRSTTHLLLYVCNIYKDGRSRVIASLCMGRIKELLLFPLKCFCCCLMAARVITLFRRRRRWAYLDVHIVCSWRKITSLLS